MTTYKITGYFDGVIYAQYQHGLLQMAMVELANSQQLKDKNQCAPDHFDMLPLQEYRLLHSFVLKAVELKPKTVAEKVAMFCLKYKQYKNQPYRATKEEKANLKLVTVNEQLLKAYFTNTAYPLTHVKSMADYVRHYNTVRDLAANGVPEKKSSFPDVYDKLYEKTISEDITKLQRYWGHLRKMGWKKVDGVWEKVERQ